ETPAHVTERACECSSSARRRGTWPRSRRLASATATRSSPRARIWTRQDGSTWARTSMSGAPCLQTGWSARRTAPRSWPRCWPSARPSFELEVLVETGWTLSEQGVNDVGSYRLAIFTAVGDSREQALAACRTRAAALPFETAPVAEAAAVSV